MNIKPIIGVAGATGLVGNEIVQIIKERKLPFTSLRLFGSEDAEGEVYEVGNGEESVIEKFDDEGLAEADILIFACAKNLAEKHLGLLAQKGKFIVDTSGAALAQPGAQIVVPEVNGEVLAGEGKVFVSPRSSVCLLAEVLKRVHNSVGLSRVVVSTYQGVSGAGKYALDELWEQTLSVFNQGDVKVEHLPHQIAFNVIPQIDSMLESGLTREEVEVVTGLRSVLNLPHLPVSITAVRVPVLHGVGMSVNISTTKACSPDSFAEAMKGSALIEVSERSTEYPLQLEVVGSDAVRIGRLRVDDSVPNGISFWLAADNLRKGSALNAVQIVEQILRSR